MVYNTPDKLKNFVDKYLLFSYSTCTCMSVRNLASIRYCNSVVLDVSLTDMKLWLVITLLALCASVNFINASCLYIIICTLYIFIHMINSNKSNQVRFWCQRLIIAPWIRLDCDYQKRKNGPTWQICNHRLLYKNYSKLFSLFY